MSRVSETPDNVLETYDWQDVAEDLQNKLANAQYTINKLIDGNNKVNKENKQLKVELQEANDSITWWQNRFNAVERDNKQLNNEIQLRIKSIEKLENNIIEYQRKIQTIKRNCKRDKAKLRNRIDKAIEYIKPNFIEQGGLTSYEVNDLLNDLLEILGDK